MSRGRQSSVQMGHDAFLDIVANLVGILIILVVVLGTQSHSAIQQVQQDQPEMSSQDQMDTLGQLSVRAASAQSDSNRFEARIKELDSELEKRGRQRGVLLDLLAHGQEAWERMQTNLDEESVRMAEQNRQLQSAQNELARLQGQRLQLEEQEAPVVTLQHLPTPMAKTVFGEEIHFRLKDNRLSVVPIDPLVKAIKRDFARTASTGRFGSSEAAVGPIRGYVAKYLMQKSQSAVARGGSVSTGVHVEVVKLVVQPLQEPYGNPIETVFENQQLLDVELAGRNPGATTVTVWVYPDSFGSFRKLKELLYQKGFATAARVLPEGKQITGGPGGSRSRAQ